QADYAPYFFDNGPGSRSGNMALYSLSEDTPIGSHIYTLNGSDPENDPVRFGLTFEKGSKEYFEVDPKTGNVTLIEELDREKQDEIEVLVSITDGRNKVVEKVRVFVTDANDQQPEFQNLPFVVNVPEVFNFMQLFIFDTATGSSIYKVLALDRDMGSGGSVTYYLQSNPMNKFAIDGHSGVLRIKPGETLDYEACRTHVIKVLAKDGGGKFKGKYLVMSSSATVTVNVIDTQDTPPTFVGTPYFGYVYEVSVPGSEIFTVYAKDGDQGNPHPIHYAIINGSDDVFTINSTSGCVTLLTYPIYLNKEFFELKIKVGLSGFLLHFHMTAHEPSSQELGANAKFNLRLVGPNHVLRVVPQTVLNEAQVTVIVENSAAIDYERHHSLAFKLLAVEIDTPERFSATADIIIHLLDTNDNIPKFSSEFYIARIPENSPGGSSVISVAATDPDSGLWGNVKYTIYGSGADLFIIHSTSGVIYTQPWAALDAEVKSKYNFYVKAEDAEGKYSLAEVFVTVLDQNDHPPEFDDNVFEKTMVIGDPVKIEAVDDDAEEPNNVIEYSIMKADPGDIFDINMDTGEIVLKSYIKSMDIVQNITKHKDCTWSLVVQARDRGSPSFSTTAVVKIDLTEATQLKGPMAAFLMQSRDNPLKAIGVVAGFIGSMVVVTVLISTAIYMRNTKSNRIMPTRRVIRKRPKDYQPWTSKLAFKTRADPSGKFLVRGGNGENHNGNNNVRRPPPPPPCAPTTSVPPLSSVRHSEWQQTVPTVSGEVASKTNRKFRRNRDEVSSALVSELKMRLEQRMLESTQSYY
uniref:Photoreceptor cadherin n=1 Tax=Paramormyrops kingsleyae TaxID=1676925 RepID=A0A3B3S047_9TELE